MPLTPADLGGDTPLVRFEQLLGASGPAVYAKLESYNPTGSVKDRPAKLLIEEALRDGRIARGDQVIESSSGNFGVALARQCRLHGLDFTCVIDPRTNRGTQQLIRAYGGRLHLVEEPDDATGDWLVARLAAVERMLRGEHAAGKRAWWPNQYASEGNARAHAVGTMHEIWEEIPVHPDVVLVATSTTGTLSGCMTFAAKHGEDTKFVAVDAMGSVLFGGQRGERKLPGFGAGILPKIAKDVRPDAVLRVTDLECVIGCRVLAATEAYLAGASGGGAVSALWSLDLAPHQTVCLILHDGGERYLDTVYDDAWVRDELGCSPEELADLVTTRIPKDHGS